jgi:hypothetical protein
VLCVEEAEFVTEVPEALVEVELAGSNELVELSCPLAYMPKAPIIATARIAITLFFT